MLEYFRPGRLAGFWEKDKPAGRQNENKAAGRQNRNNPDKSRVIGLLIGSLYSESRLEDIYTTASFELLLELSRWCHYFSGFTGGRRRLLRDCDAREILSKRNRTEAAKSMVRREDLSGQRTIR